MFISLCEQLLMSNCSGFHLESTAVKTLQRCFSAASRPDGSPLRREDRARRDSESCFQNENLRQRNHKRLKNLFDLDWLSLYRPIDR
jgi:hypothetical protein